LAPDLGLFGGGRTFRRWGHVVEKKLGHWGHALEGDWDPAPPHFWLLPGHHEPQAPTMMCLPLQHKATQPSGQGLKPHETMSPNKPFLLKSWFISIFVTVVVSWLTEDYFRQGNGRQLLERVGSLKNEQVGGEVEFEKGSYKGMRPWGWSMIGK
jgi:hypothetical protein